jgi:hypothetical protein
MIAAKGKAGKAPTPAACLERRSSGRTKKRPLRKDAKSQERKAQGNRKSQFLKKCSLRPWLFASLREKSCSEPSVAARPAGHFVTFQKRHKTGVFATSARVIFNPYPRLFANRSSSTFNVFA